MASNTLQQKRRIYAGKPIPSTANPFTLFAKWFQDAEQCSIEYNAMTLATVNHAGRPSARQVLLKDFSINGFSFYTNLESRKSKDLSKNKYVALVFYWAEMHRQVRIEGHVIPVATKEADAYFASRPRGSQIGAWISKQSRPINDRKDIVKRYADLEAKYAGKNIPRPPHWGGFTVVPNLIEFWSGMPDRLHDRVVFIKTRGKWGRRRLQP